VEEKVLYMHGSFQSKWNALHLGSNSGNIVIIVTCTSRSGVLARQAHLGGGFTSHDDSPGHQHSWVLSRYDLIIEALT
jgi:hypothetical protein